MAYRAGGADVMRAFYQGGKSDEWDHLSAAFAQDIESPEPGKTYIC